MSGAPRRLCVWVALALLLPHAPGAAEVGAAAPAKVALKARRILDVAAGAHLAGVVLVEGSTIKAIAPANELPGDYTVVDLGEATLLPGLIDAHAHLLSGAAIERYSDQLLTQSQAARALAGAAHARRTLHAGFTTVRDVANEGSGYADVALRDAIRQGLVEGPRLLVATRGIAVTGKYYPFGISPDLPDFPRGAQMISGAEEARRAVREQIGNGADLIKIFADWDYPTMTAEELQVLVEESHKAGRPVAAHATTPQGVRNAVEAGVDSIEHGFAVDVPTLKLMKKKGIFLVPTLHTLAELLETVDAPVRPRVEEYLNATRDTVRAAKRIGVRIAYGSDAASGAAHGRNARELLALRDAGLTPAEALRAATVDAAELLRLQDRVGTLDSGKQADIIAVAGDPLADLAAVEKVIFVMQAGKVVRRE